MYLHLCVLEFVMECEIYVTDKDIETFLFVSEVLQNFTL
jgi:hypothetical protein